MSKTIFDKYCVEKILPSHPPGRHIFYRAILFMVAAMRTFYIVTLAHRERSGVAYKVAFGNAVADCFEAMHGEVSVVHWACAEARTTIALLS